MAGSPWTNQVVNLIELIEQATGFTGLFAYSPKIAANDMTVSITANSGTDPEGNAYQAGVTTYNGPGFWAQLLAGQLQLNAAAGQFVPAIVVSNVEGALALSSGEVGSGDTPAELLLESTTASGGSGRLAQFITDTVILEGSTTVNINLTVEGGLTVNTGASISGGLTVDTINGSSSTGGPNDTGFFNTQGLASGSYGSTHQHTLPNFPTATHGHAI